MGVISFPTATHNPNSRKNIWSSYFKTQKRENLQNQKLPKKKSEKTKIELTKKIIMEQRQFLLTFD